MITLQFKIVDQIKKNEMVEFAMSNQERHTNNLGHLFVEMSDEAHILFNLKFPNHGIIEHQEL